MTAATNPNADNPFLAGLLEPVHDERFDENLEVEGEIPARLNGMFVRNGPNPQFDPMTRYHPFDGDGMLHAVYFGDGKASYRNRWIESLGLQAERKRGKSCFGGLSEFTLPSEDIMEEVGIMKNNANTNFIRHAGHYFALMEGGKPTETTRDLETIGEYDFGGKLQGSMTAHPRIDPVTGDLVFFGYSPFPPFLQYYVANAKGELIHHAIIDIPEPVIMHDFVVTRNYTLFLDSPAVFDVEGKFKGQPGVAWVPELGTRLGVLPRFGGADEIRWFDVDTANVVHFFNAWEDGKRLEIYAPVFDTMPGGLQFDAPEQAEEPHPYHWTVDLDAGTTKGERMDDRPGEFPRVNDDYATGQTRFLYNSLARDWAFEFNFNGVIKYDLETGRSAAWEHAANETSGEHCFVPDPAGTAEDDGWLMTIVSDNDSRDSSLVMIDARDVEAGPVARVKLPRRVPIGFHANWIAADS